MKTYNERSQGIDEKIKTKRRKRKHIRVACIASGVFAFLTAINLTLFVPYDIGGLDISKYKDDEYYLVIKQLSELTHGKREKTNNYKELSKSLSSIKDAFEGDMAPPMSGVPNDDNLGTAPPDVETPPNQNYEEVTNNQTNGVIEGDLFKRSDKYIYYLQYVPEEYVIVESSSGYQKKYIPAHYALKIYSIAGEQSSQVGELSISATSESSSITNYYSERELFLSKDCQTITVLTPEYSNADRQLYTTLISINVSNPAEPKEEKRVHVSGSYVSSRIADEQLLLVSNYHVKRNVNYENKSEFLPQIGEHGNMQSFPLSHIILPDVATSANFTVVSSLNAQTLAVNDSAAFLSFSDEVYVSNENVYVTRNTIVEEQIKKDLIKNSRVTEIRQVRYTENKLEVQPSLRINGWLNDRFSLDEYQGVLRAFTNGFDRYNRKTTNESVLPDLLETFPYANLYCIDLKSREIIAKEENFAPEREQVMSARFQGNTAYVCTAIVYQQVATDPVFAFDLSDYSNIKRVDTGTIPGYSLSLMPFADDTLLGVGYGDNLRQLNVSVYRQTESSVDIVAQFQADSAVFSRDHKAYYIDKENGLIGLWANYIDKNGEPVAHYLLLHYDGYELNLMKAISSEQVEYANEMRATLIDGTFYLLGRNSFQVITL